MPDNFERFVRWYLRFNGYFTSENFYVHNPDKVFLGNVGNDTDATARQCMFASRI
jgi:hypothetical protein